MRVSGVRRSWLTPASISVRCWTCRRKRSRIMRKALAAFAPRAWRPRGEIDVAALAEAIGRSEAEMFDRHQFAAHEPDGEAEQYQGQAELGADIGEARAEGKAHHRYQHVHHVTIGKLDLDQDLVATDRRVDEERPPEIGFECALQLASDDVEGTRAS